MQQQQQPPKQPLVSKAPADEEGSAPPDLWESGRVAEWARTAVVAVGCFACCVALAWTGLFVALCVLLARDNTAEVHSSCGGLWDFVLVSLLSPVLMPLAYCGLSCCISWTEGWTTFSCVACAVMGTVSVHMSLTYSENAGCIAALGEPPLLLFAVYIKSIIYGVGALSAFYARRQRAAPPPPAAAAEAAWV